MELLQQINEYYEYMNDDEGKVSEPEWWNNGWYDCEEYSQDWGERLLDLAYAELQQAQADRDALVRMLETLYDAVKFDGDKVCKHGNTTAYPVWGWWCDQCWLPVEEYFKAIRKEIMESNSTD